MTTAQPNPVELAKQGDVRAIAFLINRSLQSKGILAKPVLKDGCLRVMLEAAQTPDEQTLAPFIYKGVMGLGIASVRMLKVYGRKTGSKSLSWSREFDLQEQSFSSASPVSLQSTSSQVCSPKQPSTVSQQKVQQEKTALSDHLLLECKGENGILVLTELGVVIKRKGGILSPYKKGEKHISYGDILNLQYERSKLMSPGYLYFQLPDSKMEVTFLEANGSESGVTFLSSQVQDFDKAKEILTERFNIQNNQSAQEVVLKCKGYDGFLILKDAEVVIRKKDFIGIKDKDISIPYGDIVDFQYRRSNLVSRGFIYLQLPGAAKEITFLSANISATSITFTHEKAHDFDRARDILVQKTNPNKYDNVFEGRSGDLILTKTGVIIKRSGGLLNSHSTGEKTIPYKSITAVQFKKADLTVGFIQLTLKGGVEAKGGAFEAVTDENTVTFGTEEKTQEFERAKTIIGQRIIEADSVIPVANNNSDLDQLEKLASLKEKGIISEEEFQAKKKQILGL